MGAFLGACLMFYLAICGALVPFYFLEQLDAKIACQREHDVFQCKKAVIWTPVAKDATHD